MTIDERVVEMRFNNTQFERGIKTTINSLQSLKNGLDRLAGNSKTIGSMENTNLNPLARSIDAVSSKFSSFGVMATTVLSNIATDAYNAGKRLVNAFTVDLIKDGWTEYELKMGSVQTIMNSTGESLETVMKYLEDLNTYADRTIYSFSDMTENIGKFTNAGVSLHDATAAIQGVSNVAAISGANANEASRAMYNFAQALSAGSVKLIDWKSIENANMATVQFKNELISTAVELGTLTEKNGKYISTTKDLNGKVSDAFTATSMFNESLSHQWMTTEVLTKTLGRYADDTTEIGKAAFAAAQDVKTFSQLIDTIKESIGSGWASTFEIVIGNFEEAKELFTGINNVVGDFVNKQSEARNSILQSWRDMNGREDVIEGFKRIYEAVSTVGEAIEKAMQQVFHTDDFELLGRNLSAVTYKFRSLAGQFRDFISDEKRAEKFYEIFKGIFSGVDLFIRGISAILTVIGRVVIFCAPVIDAFLNVAASIAKVVTSIDQFVQSTGAFKNIVNAVTEVLGPFANGIKAIFGSLGYVMDGYFANDVKTSAKVMEPFFQGLEESRAKAAENLEKFKGFISNMKQTAKDFVDAKLSFLDAFGRKKAQEDGLGFLDKFTSKFSEVGIFKAGSDSFAGGVANIGNAMERLWGIIEKIDINRVLDLINTIIYAFIMNGKKNFFDFEDSIFGQFSDIAKNFNGTLKSITGVLDGTRNALNAWQQQLKAKALLTLAIAVGVLAASLMALSVIPADKLAAAMGAVTVVFVELFAALFAFQKIMLPGNFVGALTVAVLFNSLATAVLVLSASIAILGQLGWEQIAKGLIAVAGAMTLLVGAAWAMNNVSIKFNITAVGLIALASAIGILAVSVAALGSLDVKTLAKGLGTVLGILGELAAFMALAQFGTLGLKTAASITVLSVAIGALALSVAGLGSLDIKTIGKGLGAMAGVLAEVIALFYIMPPKARLLAISASMFTIAEAMKSFAKVMRSMAVLDTEGFLKGLGGIAAIMGILIASAALMPSTSIIDATAFVVMAYAVNELAKAMYILGDMDIKQLGVALAGLAGSLTVLGVAMYAMGSNFKGAAAISVISVALTSLASAVYTLSKLPISGIAVAVGALAAVFTTLGIAAKLLTPLVAPILAISGAVAALGVACLSAGAGVLMFSMGLANLAVTGEAGAIGFVAALRTILNSLPIMAKEISGVIKSISYIIIDTSPTVFRAIQQLGTDLIKTLAKWAIVAVEEFVVVFVRTLEVIADNTRAILDAFKRIADEVYAWIQENAPQWVKDIIDLAVTFVNAFGEHLYKLVDSAYQLMTKFIDAMGIGFAENAPELIESLERAILNILQGLADAIEENSGKIEDAIRTVAEDLVNEAKAALGIGPAGESSKFTEIGKNVIKGIVKGLLDNGPIGLITRAARTVSNTVTNALQNALGINSPSKVAEEEVGVYIPQGIAEGITKDKSAEEAAKKKAQSITEAFQTELNKLKLQEQTITLENQLFDVTYGYELGESDKTALEVDRAIEKIDIQTKRVALAEAEHAQTVKALGDNADASREAYNKLLQEQINLQELSNNYVELQAQFEEQRQALDEEALSLSEQLFDAMYGDKLTDVEKTSVQIDRTIAKIQKQTEKMSAAEKAYSDIAKKLGEDSGAAKEAYNSLLSEQLELVNLSNSYNDLQKQATSQLNQALETNRSAMNEYAKYITENKQFLLDMGFSMSEIEKSAQEMTGYDPTLFAKGMSSTAQDATVVAMSAVAQTYEEKSEKTFGSLTNGFSEWGSTYAEAVGNGFVGAFEKVSVNVNTRLDILDNELRTRIHSLVDDINAELSRIDINATITPVVNLDDISSIGTSNIGAPIAIASSTFESAGKVSKSISYDYGSATPTEQHISNTYTFNQTNNSPTALSRIDIYRNTKNQFAQFKEATSR